MNTVTFYVELVRSSGPQFPYGEFGCRYRLFLPLNPDGCVDTDALRRGDDRYRGTRLRAGDGEAAGRIIAGSRGRFILEYDELKFYPSTLHLGSAPIAPGSLMRIGEYDGEADEFRISSIRKLSATQATLTEDASFRSAVDAGRRNAAT